jgi:hypothetical protein
VAGRNLYKVGLLKNCVTHVTDVVQGCHNVSVCDLIYLASDYIEFCYAVGLKLYPKTKVFHSRPRALALASVAMNLADDTRSL